MSPSEGAVADEGVEFLLELTAKLDDATKMVRELGKTEAAALKADAALKKAEKQTGILGRVMHSAGESIGDFARETLAHFTALAGFEGLKRLGEGVIDLGKEALEAAGEAERTRASFRLLMGEAPGDELLDFLDNLAQYTEFTDGPLKELAGSLINVGFAGEGLDKALAASLDIAAGFKNKMEGAAAAVGLLEKAQLKGTIGDRDIRAAKISPKAFYARLQGELGGSLKDVQTKLESGKVKTGVILEALYAEIGAKTKKPLGGAGVAMSHTFLAQVEKVQDIIPNLFEELEKGEGLKHVTAALAQLAQSLDPGSPTGKKIVVGLEHMIDAFADLITKVDIEKFANTLMTVFERLPGLINATVKALELLTPALKLLGSVVPDPVKLGSAKDTAVRGQIIDEKAKHPILGRIGAFFVDPMQADREGRARLEAEKTGRAIGEGTAAGVKKSASGAVDATFSMLDDIRRAPAVMLQIHSPSKVYADAAWNTGLGWLRGIEAIQPQIERQMAGLFDPPPPPDVRPFMSPAPVLAGAGSLGGNSTSMEANITVSIGAGAGDESAAREQADLVVLGVRRALEATLSQLAAEGGAT